MDMMNKKRVIIFIGIGIVGFGMISTLFIFFKPQGQTQIKPNHKPYSHTVMFDGNHYKIIDTILHEHNQPYLSLYDLEEILDLTVKISKNQLKITYGENQLRYKNTKLVNNNKKENETKSYITKNKTIFIPKEHIEKYLGVKVDYYLDQKTRTLALMSPNEQQKERYDQHIGTTIFLHKNHMPQEKYEPRNGIYLGGYVLQDEHIEMSMSTFNQLTGKKHASYFKYVGYGQPFPTEWVTDVINKGGFPHIAWEPNNGLDEVRDDAYLREFAREANKANVPILLRYASEMNGTWTAYSGDSKLYIEKWKLVHRIMKEEAPNVMMLWNVFTMPENSIMDYYPGDEYVDYIGVNIYNVVYHNDRLDNRSDFEDPLRLLDYVYNTFSHKKPIVIGEFGATNYNVTDGLYHVDFAIEKISRMYKYIPRLYPRVKFIYYFDVNNLVNAPEGRKINNYAITENPRITDAYAKFVKEKAYLSEVQQDAPSMETFSYRDFLFYFKGDLFVDIQFIQDYLDMKVEQGGKNIIEVIYDEHQYKIKTEELTIDKAAFYEKRVITGVPIDELLNAFRINYQYKGENLHIFAQ